MIGGQKPREIRSHRAETLYQSSTVPTKSKIDVVLGVFVLFGLVIGAIYLDHSGRSIEYIVGLYSALIPISAGVVATLSKLTNVEQTGAVVEKRTNGEMTGTIRRVVAEEMDKRLPGSGTQ